MATLRKRRQFPAQILTLQGQPLSDCFAIVDVETTVAAGRRSVSWRGRISSLSAPEHSFDGPFLLRPRDHAATDATDHSASGAARISVTTGAKDRLGITSDEYEFIGVDTPPELP